MKISGEITLEYVKSVAGGRVRNGHKGDFGKILVIAGSKGMAGAAVLCGRAAFKAGAGLVCVSISEELFPIIQTALPEATCVPRRAAMQGLSAYGAIAIGPGLGDCPENKQLVKYALNEYDKTVVLDADGLNALAWAGEAGAIKNAKASVIITPHIGEARRLIGSERLKREWPSEDVRSEAGRLKIAELLLAETGAIVVLKGAGSLVAGGDFGAYVNTTGNPGMATGGSGDVLTGIIAALSGQGKSPWDAAKAGVFIHGMAGDLAARAVGEYGMTASDIADKTAFALKEITAGGERDER